MAIHPQASRTAGLYAPLNAERSREEPCIVPFMRDALSGKDELVGGLRRVPDVDRQFPLPVRVFAPDMDIPEVFAHHFAVGLP